MPFLVLIQLQQMTAKADALSSRSYSFLSICKHYIWVVDKKELHSITLNYIQLQRNIIQLFDAKILIAGEH
ncbi:MAG: hypothetical protein ACI8WB_000591 [Phenylobacterium sp.]|jgi:hypothetical protein